MANEIYAAATLKCTKGTYPAAFSSGGASVARRFTMTGTNQSLGIASIGTATHEAIPVADIGTPGYAFFHNLDATNYVEIGSDTAGTFRPFAKLKAGQFCLVPLSIAPYAKANTAACDLEYAVIEE